MFLALFHPEARCVFLGNRGKKSPFGHMFGGATDYAGLAAYKRQPPVHLLFRLNTADPAVGFRLPGTQWLPLLCAIRYGACDLGYRVVSDAEVKILYQSDKKAWPGFPYKGYPEMLPSQPVALVEGIYDPSKVADGLYYAAVFGYGALSPRQYAKLLRHVEKERLPEMFGWESAEAYLEEGNGQPFVQGRPMEDCPELSCVNHGQSGSLRTLAIFQEGNEHGRKLWGPNCGSLQIIYQACPECGALRTTNQCT